MQLLIALFILFRMPYTEATIMETLRFSSMVPLGIFHRALEDTELGNQVIPKVQ